MAFAEIKSDFSYWQKQKEPLFGDLAWNIPEQKTGMINVVGGNVQSFHAVMRLAEGLAQGFPIRRVSVVLPDALRGKLPALENLSFAPSTESGSFARSPELKAAMNNGDLTILAGDLSRNSATAAAMSEAIDAGIEVSKPLLLMRDAVDLLATDAARFLVRENCIMVASMAQLQKVFRAVYYPKMLMLSQPLVPVIETLHKFTLTYPATVLTFHQEQIIVAHGGEVVTTPLEKTKYMPISLWTGELAGKVAALNLFNPGKLLEATSAAVLM